MKTYRYISTILIICFTALNSWGEVNFGAKYAGEFMTLGADARASGMGEAQVAQSGSPASAYWNPASLNDIRNGGILLMHADRFAGVVKYDFFGAAQRLSSNEVIALTIFNLRVDDIPITAINPDNVVQAVKWTSDMETALSGSYSRRFSDKLYAGGSGKIISKRVADHQAWGIGFDLGMRYNFKDWLKLGLKLSDITTTLLAWDTGLKEVLLPSAALGFSLQKEMPSLEAELSIAGDIVLRGEDRGEADELQMGIITADTHLGLEYVIKRTLSLRVGRDREYLTAGAGLKLGPVNADYAFQAHSDLGDSHRVSLSYLWSNRPFFLD